MAQKENLQNSLIQKSKQPKDKILELIEWIDENKSRVFKTFDMLGGTAWSLIFVIVILAISSAVVNFTVSDFAVKTSLQFATIAVLIAYVSLGFQIGEKGLLERRFGRATKLKSFNDKEKVLVWALIKIKNENEEINLKTLYIMDKAANGDYFTEKNLLGILCK